MSRADVAARDLTASTGSSNSPVDVDAIAEKLGILVVLQAGDPAIHGILLRRGDQPAIGLNPMHPQASRRFALAHAIGHFRLHARRDVLLDISTRHTFEPFPSLPTDREEAEANRFAGALLAPEPAIRRLAAETDRDQAGQLPSLLAQHFGLSLPVMSYRLISLGIVMDL